MRKRPEPPIGGLPVLPDPLEWHILEVDNLSVPGEPAIGIVIRNRLTHLDAQAMSLNVAGLRLEEIPGAVERAALDVWEAYQRRRAISELIAERWR